MYFKDGPPRSRIFYDSTFTPTELGQYFPFVEAKTTNLASQLAEEPDHDSQPIMDRLIESIHQLTQKINRKLEPDLVKRRYFEFLERNPHKLSQAQRAQTELLDQLTDDQSNPLTRWHLDAAEEVAKTLCDFGHPCALFDNQTYIAAIGGGETDINDIWSIFVLQEETRKINDSKLVRHQLTGMDVRHTAAIVYHLRSLQWSVSKICPLLHSPFKSGIS